MKSIIIDNVGFDVDEMSKLSETEFKKLFFDNPAISFGKTKEQKEDWIKQSFLMIQKESGKTKKPNGNDN